MMKRKIELLKEIPDPNFFHPKNNLPVGMILNIKVTKRKKKNEYRIDFGREGFMKYNLIEEKDFKFLIDDEV